MYVVDVSPDLLVLSVPVLVVEAVLTAVAVARAGVGLVLLQTLGCIISN